MTDDFKPDSPWNWVDWDRLQDALVGLIKNADEDHRLRREYSEQLDIKNKQIRELTQKVVTLETKIKMLERGSV